MICKSKTLNSLQVGKQNGNSYVSAPQSDVAKNFHKWFDGSYLVNDDGTPIICYHGTDDTMNEFKIRKTEDSDYGIYFSADENYANEYGKKTCQCYISMKKPFIMEIEPTDAYGLIIIKNRIIGFYRHLSKEAMDTLIKKGYDGIVVSVKGNFMNMDGTLRSIPVNPFEVVLFDSKQIKSVDNEGTFDANNGNIFK